MNDESKELKRIEKEIVEDFERTDKEIKEAMKEEKLVIGKHSLPPTSVSKHMVTISPIWSSDLSAVLALPSVSPIMALAMPITSTMI